MMRTSNLAAAGLAAACGLLVTISGSAAAWQTRPASPPQPAREAIYVSPTGSDAADGLSPSRPLKTLERAQKLLESTGRGTVYLMNGLYRRTQPLLILPGDRTQRWLAYPGAKPILDGGGTVPDAIQIKGNNVTVSGLTMRNFHDSGMLITGVRNISVTDNVISNIGSPGNNRAGVLLWSYAIDVTVARNRISNTDYAGIAAYAVGTDEIVGAKIVGNVLTNTCQRIPDCGAIYLLGRAAKSTGTVIQGNTIHNYGPATAETKAIYLDDDLSQAVITGNRISGSGSYAIQIHGGRGNMVRRNMIRVKPGQPALFYQTWGGSAIKTMAGNAFVDNQIVVEAPVKIVEVKYDGRATPPLLRNNRIVRP